MVPTIIHVHTGFLFWFLSEPHTPSFKLSITHPRLLLIHQSCTESLLRVKLCVRLGVSRTRILSRVCLVAAQQFTEATRVYLFPSLCSVTSQWWFEVGPMSVFVPWKWTNATNQDSSSSFFFFEDQFTKYHSYKVSSLLSRQKGKLPTTVQCERYGQIAVVAQWGPSFSTSVVWRSYKGGVIWILKEKKNLLR